MEKLILECISFSTANIHMLIERRRVLGMASSFENNNLKINTIEHVFGLACATDLLEHKKSILTVSIGNGQLNIQVNEPVKIIKIKSKNIHPLPRFLASRIKLPCIRAIAVIDKSIAIIIDPLKIIE